MNMPCNVGRNCLVRLGFNTLKFNKIQNRRYTIATFDPKTCILFKKGPSPSYTKNKRYFQQKGQKSEEKNESDQDNSSQFHQNYHRRSYERKRFRYENDDDNQDQTNSKSSLRFEDRTDITHYQRLNIDAKADLSAIKSAYYSLSKVYHPDVVGPGNAEASENFRLITESYDTLSNADTREEYDELLHMNEENKLSPDGLAWKPNGFRPNVNSFSKRSNPDLIFRMRMDQALELEKIRNPQKFRAGAFKDRYHDSKPKERLEMLKKQLSTLESELTFRNCEDGRYFYRIHMRDTIRRKKSGLQSTSMYEGSPSKDSDSASLVAILCAGVILIYMVINTFFDIDLAANLDSRLTKSMRKNDRLD